MRIAVLVSLWMFYFIFHKNKKEAKCSPQKCIIMNGFSFNIKEINNQRFSSKSLTVIAPRNTKVNGLTECISSILFRLSQFSFTFKWKLNGCGHGFNLIYADELMVLWYIKMLFWLICFLFTTNQCILHLLNVFFSFFFFSF